jgi:type IV secretion system protein VirD4
VNVLLLLVVAVVAAVLFWRRCAYLAAIGCGAFAALAAWTLLRQLPWWAYVIGVVLAVGLGWHHLSRSAALITRWTGRTRRSAGTASSAAIARRASGRALRGKVRKVRPALADLGRWALLRVPVAEYGIELCRTGVQTVWASIEDVTLVFGGPRTGKTGWLAGRIIDAPGAVLVTSTRTDLLALCGPLRAKEGPVWVFNAVGLGGIPSTVTFDPLTGCTDPETAVERATDMIGAVSHGGGGDREFWDAQARRALAMLLHAAALGGYRMGRVLTWIGEPDVARREVSAALQRSPMEAFAQDAAQFLGTNSKTQTSITTTMTLALGWLNNRAANEAAAPGHGFDVEQLLRERATVFLLGAEEAQVAPLMCALTGHIARQARQIAVRSPGGRLDPPLGLYLDEAFLICPVPLESWTADMGGRNVTIIAVFQSRQQMIDRYGAAKTGQIMTNAAAKVIFGGTGDRDDLIFWSTLGGDRDEPIWTTDPHGRGRSRTVRSVPVMAPAQIANLPEGRVLVFRRGINPVLGRARMAWRRRDVRAHAFAVAHPELAARLARWAAIGRRRWVSATRPIRACAATCRRWMTATGTRTGAAIGRWVRALHARARRLIARLRPVPREVLVDLDPPTVEIPLPVPAGPAHTHGDAHWQRPGSAPDAGAGRPDVPFGQAWWNP